MNFCIFLKGFRFFFEWAYNLGFQIEFSSKRFSFFFFLFDQKHARFDHRSVSTTLSGTTSTAFESTPLVSTNTLLLLLLLL